MTLFALTAAWVLSGLGIIAAIALAIKALPVIWSFVVSLARGLVAFNEIAPHMADFAEDATHRSEVLASIQEDMKRIHKRIDEHMLHEEAELTSTNDKLEELRKMVSELQRGGR